MLHGIRDLGRWASDFERRIAERYPMQRSKLRVVSPRYGYFGMGPFLFEEVRDRYARWFMDQYTETLAAYPNVRPENVHFFGHSNGTYLLASALKSYESMYINRVVFAGSVVPKAYNWVWLGRRVQQVRNYVASDDLVVALFPRLFELPVFALLGNEIGSAGFNGFEQEGAGPDRPTVQNVKYVKGGHGAFESRVDEIVDFLLQPGEPSAAKIDERATFGPGWWGSSAFSVLLIWLLLAAALMFVAVRVVGAMPTPAWPALLLFTLLVVRILQTV